MEDRKIIEMFFERSEEAIAFLNGILSDGKDVRQFMRDWISHYRNLMMVKFMRNPETVVSMSAENIERMRRQASVLELEDINRGIMELSQMANEARWSTQPRILLELAIVRLCMGAGQIRELTEVEFTEPKPVPVSAEETVPEKKPVKKADIKTAAKAEELAVSTPEEPAVVNTPVEPALAEMQNRFDKPVIRYNSMKELDTSLKEISGENMPPAYAGNPIASGPNGHGGMDYAMLDEFFKAILENKPAPIPLRAGLAMTLPGIYAEESAKRGGQVLRMRYPWEEDWTAKII